MAQRRLAKELDKLPKAVGTRGTAKGSTDGSGSIVLVPPENDAPTLKEVGMAKKRAARAKRIAEEQALCLALDFLEIQIRARRQ